MFGNPLALSIRTERWRYSWQSGRPAFADAPTSDTGPIELFDVAETARRGSRRPQTGARHRQQPRRTSQRLSGSRNGCREPLRFPERQPVCRVARPHQERCPRPPSLGALRLWVRKARTVVWTQRPEGVSRAAHRLVSRRSSSSDRGRCGRRSCRAGNRRRSRWRVPPCRRSSFQAGTRALQAATSCW